MNSDLVLDSFVVSCCCIIHLSFIALMNLETIIIEESVGNAVTTFDIHNNINLQELFIGSEGSKYSFVGVTSVNLSQLESLKNLTIGNHVFSSATAFELPDSPLETLVMRSECFQRATVFSISKASSLQTISIGALSFMNVSSVSLNNADRLEQFAMGPSSFLSAVQLVITNATQLKQFIVEDSCFTQAHLFTVEFGGRPEESVACVDHLTQFIVGASSFMNAELPSFSHCSEVELISIGDFSFSQSRLPLVFNGSLVPAL